MKKNYFISLLILFSVIGSYAQITTSNIKGLILDDQNQPLPGANVVAVHSPTGTKYGGITNFDGRYNLLNMRVGGPYLITISYVGFATQEINDGFLELGKTLSMDIVMKSDSEQLDAVVITGNNSGSAFGKDRTGSQTNVGRRELTRLPTISRSASDFTRLEPSASGDSFGGRNSKLNNFSLDGAIFNNPFGLDAPTPGGQVGAQPISLDAIDQISVSLAPYDVTQSGFTGASVNAVTKSGTNEFHGTVYAFYRDESFTGGKIKEDEVVRPDLFQTQYGVSIGGPIVKNKLFFFANFEKDDRGDLGTNGWEPNTGSGSVSESRVLEGDLIAVQEALSNLGYDTGAYQGFSYGSESSKGILKLDWNINDNNRLAVVYNFLNASKEKPAHPSAIGLRGPSFSTLQFENSGYKITNELKSIQLELNSTISDKISNKLQIGHTSFHDFRNPFSVPAPVITIQDGAGSNYIIAGHEPFSINNDVKQKVFQVTNNLNIVNGNHTYTVGFSYEKFAFENSFNLVNYESFNFGIFPYFGIFSPYPSVQSFLDNAQPGGVVDQYLGATQNAFDSFEANGAGNDGGWKLAEINVGQLSFYLQDEWNANDNFKLTYGVRFDKPLYFDLAENVQKFIDTDNTATRDNSVLYFNPNTNQEVTINSTVLPGNKFLISPRLGFNWDATKDGKNQVRGGTGVFTGRFPFVWLGNQVTGADDGLLQVVDPDFKWPQVWRTNLGLDHKFENRLTASLDISYTADLNGQKVQNWGLRNPSATLDAPGDNRPIYLDSDKGNKAYVFTNSSSGRTWNTSLKLQKTFKNGLFTSLAYNYLDAKDVNSIENEISSGAFGSNAIVRDPNGGEKSFSKYGDKHRIIGVASKQFKYGNNNKWSTTISTFFEYAQGARFNYVYAGDINSDTSSDNDLLYIPTPTEVQQMQFSGAGQAVAFEAYIQQDDYLSSNRGSYAERYGAISPWRSRWDFKFLQDYRFNDTNKIQFSVDVLNMGNLINSNWGVVSQPNTTRPLGVSVDADTNVPIYTFNSSLTDTFGFDSSLLSRWQVQIGLRYIF